MRNHPFTIGDNNMAYLTERQRYEIEAYLKAGLKPEEIAKLVGKCVRTIYYEIKRGKCKQLTSELEEKEIYLADVSQRKYNENKLNKGSNLKIGNDIKLCQFIEHKIKDEKYSPYATLQFIKSNHLEFKTQICTQTLYNYIDKGIILNVSNQDLPMKPTRKKKNEERAVSLNNLKGTSIEQRPQEIKERQEYGNWEMDTVVGGHKKNGKECLLVLSERMTREEIIRKIPNKKAESVIKALNSLERKLGSRQFRQTFKTITCDNGTEFLNFQGIENSILTKIPRTKVYYCHPYSSWERGTNENINKMIRRFIPKGANIEDYSKEEIAKIQSWINNYPRKILGGLSVNEYKKELGIA